MRNFRSNIQRGTAMVVAILLLSGLTIKAQDTTGISVKQFTLGELNKEKLFTPIVALEAWGTYSMNEELNEATDRADFMFRRFRFGAKGNPYSWLSYSFQLNLDRLGEDSYASTKGGYGGLDIWNAFMTAKLLKNSSLLNLHVGYFWAAISREFNTSPWAVGSFDKTRANFYLRNFTTGKGNGIESGIALGGMKNFEGFAINYRLGLYMPEAYTVASESANLYTGRIMFSIGDPEQTKYSYMLSGNQWRKRKGITIGLGASSQAKGYLNDTTIWNSSTAYGVDIAVDYNGLHIDGEYFLMKRTANSLEDFEGAEMHARIGYNLDFRKTYLEPVFSYEHYEGTGSKILYKNIGVDNAYDFGINWYINKDKMKFGLHYIVQEGKDIPKLNTGDYIGACMQFRI